MLLIFSEASPEKCSEGFLVESLIAAKFVLITLILEFQEKLIFFLTISTYSIFLADNLLTEPKT